MWAFKSYITICRKEQSKTHIVEVKMNRKKYLSNAGAILLIVALVAIFAYKIPRPSDYAIYTEGTNIGDKAPELVFNSPGDKPIALSSLRGKLVLIDFWAAWCPPCRYENPNLVRVYKEFKDKEFKVGKGFAIYSVSLDKNKTSWVNAIESDNLTWDHHVSDLLGWESKAAYIYNINSIPANFLVDKNGIILAKDLRGEDLYRKLEEYLK